MKDDAAWRGGVLFSGGLVATALAFGSFRGLDAWLKTVSAPKERLHRSARERGLRTEKRSGAKEAVVPALHAGLFDTAFYINAEGSTKRKGFMEGQLRGSGARFERWPALRGSPSLLKTHARYFERGVERHLRLNRSRNGSISGWGTVGTYLSHHTLFEHIVRRWGHNDSATFLILQDDTKLKKHWLRHLAGELKLLDPEWERLLLVWWGIARRKDCNDHNCIVRPPAGPTKSGPECCGKRFFHGLQVSLPSQRVCMLAPDCMKGTYKLGASAGLVGPCAKSSLRPSPTPTAPDKKHRRLARRLQLS